MKTVIAATLFALASTGAMAGSFDYERAIGSADLFPTLQSEGAASHQGSGSSVFAYEQSIGTPNLFVTLDSLNTEISVDIDHDAMAADVPVWRDVFAAEADLHG